MKSLHSAFGVTGLIAAAIFTLVPAGRAATVEGFESNVLAPGSTLGDASIRTPNYFGISPTEGTHELLLTTINSTSDSQAPESGTNATTPPAIAAFVGSGSVGFLRNSRPGQTPAATGREGSAYKIDLGALNVGDVISFDINFLTSDFVPGGDSTADFAFYTLNGATDNVSVIADSNDAVTAFGNGSPFNLQTGYQTITINITTAGNYTLAIGVMDAGDTAGVSGLLVDNISVAPIPEPSTVGLGLAGAVLLVALRRRIKRS